MVEVLDTTQQLVAAVDAVCVADPAQLGDGETVLQLHRQLERLSAATALATAAFDAGRSWEADGARTGAAWLAARGRMPVPAARRRVSLGRALRPMPVVEAAWLAGDIGEAHVHALAAARTPATADAFRRDEAMLVEQASTMKYRPFVRALAYWCQLADPDGTEASAEAQYEARRLHVSQTFGGSWVLDGQLDPISGAIVSTTLRALEEELFRAEWAEAKARVGDGVSVADLARTPAQRRADALVEMARRARAMPAGARMPEPLISVLVGYETFAGRICELADGTVVSPGSLLRWLDAAWVERVVFDGPDQVTAVGVRRRLFDGATRRAVEVRDRECFSDYCDVAASEAQIDHVVPWAEGGLTVEANGRVACGYHNRLRERRRRGPP